MTSIPFPESSSSFSGAPTGPSHEALSTGDVVRGRYRILRMLGRGGMGTVYEASVKGAHTHVALKVMHGHLGRMPEAEARFRREARALHKLKSPHVARLLDFGRLDQGSLFLVMEQVEGRDLVAEVEARGPLSFAAAFSAIDQVCAALEDVHAAGVIHRDLKPRNVIMAPSGLTKVVDFGLAKSLPGKKQRQGKEISREGQAIGSLFYMAPEQAVGRRDVDARADVFSIGCMLYFLLMGKPPFSQRAIAKAGREGGALTFPSVCFLRSDVPAHVDEVLRVALSPDASHRFRSVSALRTALCHDRDVPTDVGSRARGRASTVPTRVAERPWLERTAWLATGAGLSLAVALAAYALWAWLAP